MGTTPEMGRRAVRKKNPYFRWEKKHIEESEDWDSDIENVATARLQPNIESLELQKQERSPVEAKDRRAQTYKVCETSTVRVKDRARSSGVETLLCSKPSKTRKRALQGA